MHEEQKPSVFSMKSFAPGIMAKLALQVALVNGLLLIGAVRAGKLLDAELGTKIAFTVGLALAGSLLALFVTYKLAMRAVSRTDQDMPWRTKASIAAAEAQAEAEAANTGAGNPTAGPGSAISPGNQPGD